MQKKSALQGFFRIAATWLEESDNHKRAALIFTLSMKKGIIYSPIFEGKNNIEK